MIPYYLKDDLKKNKEPKDKTTAKEFFETELA